MNKHRLQLMRFWMLVAKLSLLVAVVLLLASCGGASKSQQAGASSTSDIGAIEDSGKRLAGEFVLSAVEDVYRAKKAQAQPEVVLSFDESGNFKRQDKSRVEEGAYLIGTRGEFVVYIEKVNGELLGDARVERYAISDQSADSFTLSGPSKKLLLRKR